MEPDVLKPRLHVLARAVVRRGDTLLLARAKGYANTFLPGGHHEPGESLKTSLARELLEEFGLAAQVGAYLGAVEHEYGDEAQRHYELNHLFEVALLTLGESETPISREAHLDFFWAKLDELTGYGLEPFPLRRLLLRDGASSALWASTLSPLSGR